MAKSRQMIKNGIDISDIEKKNESIQKNINYDDVRRRIRQVLDIITDKENNKARASQETIGKYLFPHLGANSSTQSTMSRFVNGNKKAKGDICPDINALGKLSQLTGISLNWFLYGNSTENGTDSGIIKAHDLYRMLFIDLPTKYGMEIEVTKPIEQDDLSFSEQPYLSLKLPLLAVYSPQDKTYEIEDYCYTFELYNFSKTILAMQAALKYTREDEDIQKVLNDGIEASISKKKNVNLELSDGFLFEI